MAIVTFWGTGKEQSGRTMAVAAVATNMAIERNKRILVVSASFNNETLKKCYWSETVEKKNSIFRPVNGVELDTGIEGLTKIIQSKKVSPELITDYTKVVFKDRLEVLLGFESKNLYSPENAAKIYKEIVNIAEKYYDMVIVDLDNEVAEEGANEILTRSDIIVAMTTQKVSSIIHMKEEIINLGVSEKTILSVGRYDTKSKYNIKNLGRILGEKKELLVLPYNTLFFEAAQEGMVTDLFLKLRRIYDKNSGDAFFMEQVKKITQEILKRTDKNTLV